MVTRSRFASTTRPSRDHARAAHRAADDRERFLPCSLSGILGQRRPRSCAGQTTDKFSNQVQEIAIK
jgi:hypothetical protein